MKAFLFKIFERKGIIFINIFVIFLSFYLIWNIENFQRKISPQKYWQNKIENLKCELKKDSLKIQNLKLDLEKELALSKYHAKQAHIIAEKMNQKESDVYFQIENDHLKKIKEIKNEIDALILEEKKIKDDLDKAVCQVKMLR